jgi:CpeT protein
MPSLIERVFAPSILIAVFAVVGMIAGCQTKPTSLDSRADLDRLVEGMTGTFSSAAQAAADPDNFFDIRLQMVPIWTDRAEPDGARWLYVEQASAEALDRPYRQRVYRVSKASWEEVSPRLKQAQEAAANASSSLPTTNKGEWCLTPEIFRIEPVSAQAQAVRRDGYVSRVYTLAGDPLLFAGAAGNAAKLIALNALTPEQLTERAGCEVFLLRDASSGEEPSFMGGTIGRGCASDLRGASFATSEVVIDAKGLTSWDRGFNAAGEHVWGAEKGGYRFERVSDKGP